MPLFNSSFAEGFATGFATETSKAINKAVDRRDEEVSKAKAFAMKRAEQEDAEAAAKDARTEKAIDRMAAKFTKGGKTDWNRVYSAMMAVDGADLDSLDALFENIQKTEASGQSFNIDDVFKYAEGDPELSKLSKDDIFQALRAEYAAPTIQTSDTGLLSKIGLGAGTTGGERATEEARAFFPGATRTAITGDYGTTTVDQKPLAAAIEYGMKIAEYEKNMTPSLAEAFASVTNKIAKLDRNSPTYDKDRAELQQEYNRVEKSLQDYTRATTEETTAKGSMTANGYAKIIEDGRKSALELAGLDDKAAFVIVDGEPVSSNNPNFAAAIKAARQKVIDDYNERQVRSQMKPDGTLSFLGQQIIGTDIAMGDIFRRISTAGETTTTTTGTGDTKTASTQTDDIFASPPTEGSDTSTQGFTPAQAANQLRIQYPTAKDLISSPKGISQIKKDPAKMFDKVRELYPDVPPQTIQDIINEQLVLSNQPEEQVEKEPDFVYQTPEQIRENKLRERQDEMDSIAYRFAK